MTWVVVPDDSPPVFTGSEALRRLQEAVDTRVYTAKPADEDDLLERIRGAHTVINVRSYCRFPERVLKAAHEGGLQHLAIWGTGTDHVDLEAARRLGIVVSNTPNTATDAVAEHALALMLAIARRVTELDAAVRRGEWPRGQLLQLAGKTLGVVGTGVIGCRTAQLARGIGMHVVAWTFNPDEEKARLYGFRYVSLDELLTSADVVSLHLRASADTHHFLNRERLARMKPTALLVNTGRGSLVDEAALVEALTKGRIAGAALDVFEVEPLPAGHPLTSLPNVILSPHTAGTTAEALANGLNRTVDNVLLFLKEGKVLHRVV